MTEVLDAWLDARRAAGLTIPDYYPRMMRKLFGPELESPLAGVDPERVKELYLAACSQSGAVNRTMLSVLRVFSKWLVDAGHRQANISEGIKPTGKVNRGKPQIETMREMHAFRDVVWKAHAHGDRSALAVLIGMYLGLRTAEVLSLQGRHVDVDRRLIVPGTKTANARRTLTLPPEADDLWRALEQRAVEVGPSGWLIPGAHGKRRDRTALPEMVRAFAARAGVANADQLVFHSLRGQAASLATAGDAAIEAVARALGQAPNGGVTRRHYTTGDSQRTGRARANLQVLEGGKRHAR